jgi:iron complex outermembrane recepter protein
MTQRFLALFFFGRMFRLWGLRLLLTASALVTSGAIASTVVVLPAQAEEVVRIAQAESPASPAPQAGLAEITDISLQEGSDGVQLTIDISNASTPQVFQTQEGNALIIELEGARIGASEATLAVLPVNGVSVTTSQLNETTVKIVVESTGQVPTAFLERSEGTLLLDIALSEAIAESPESTTDAPSQETSTDDDNTIRLIVTGETDEGSDYFQPRASVGTRTDTPVIDIPQAIQVIPQQVIEDQDAQTLSEALRNVSGVFSGRVGSDSTSATPLIRGFESNNILRNGQSDASTQFGSGVTNIEQIEVIKGPASVLFGAGDLGGTVNIVTERPLYEPLYTFEIGGGSFDQYRANLDFTGPLDDQDNVAYRLNIAYETEGSFIDFQEGNFFFLAPSLQVINTDTTSLIFDFEYLRTTLRQSTTGLPAISAIGLENNTLVDNLLAGGLVLSDANRQAAGALDISANLGEPAITRDETSISRMGYRLSHEFNDSWRLNHEFLASFQETPQSSFVAATGFVQTAGQPNFSLLNRLYLDNPSSRESFNFNTNITGDFDIFGIDQTLLLGAEVSLEEERDTIIQRVATPFASSTSTEIIPPFNIFDTNYNPARFFNDLNFERVSADSLANRTRYGFYGQTQLNFSDNFLAVLGGRLDFVEQDFRDAANAFNPDPINLSETAFSPRVGLIYKPIENVALYASYSESFNPVIGQSASGEVFDSERGRQFETGIKTTLFDERLAATLAFYDLTRSNVLTQDVQNTGFQTQVGEQNSRGVELDIAGEILPGWNVVANYAYSDARVTEDNEFPVGLRLLNSPRNAASLWTTYQLQSGDLAGLGFGLGVYFVGDRNGELRRPFELPSYTRTDATIFYEKDSFRTQLNFENLFDVRYFEGARDQFRVTPGSPFGVSASVSWEF